MNIFVQIDVHIIALILCTILIVTTAKQRSSGSLQQTLFLLIQIAVAIMLILEMASWICDGSYGMNVPVLNKIINALFLGLNPLFLSLWWMYLDFFFHKDKKKVLSRSILYFIPTMLFLASSITSIWTGHIFYINEQNEYVRGSWFILQAVLMFVFNGISIFYIIRNNKNLTKSETLSFAMFHVIPLLSAIAQTMFYGLSLVWPATAVAFLLVFIYIELRNLQKDHLTGINNRRQLEEHLATQLIHNKQFSLIMIDVDDFKQINDTYGHTEGDAALQEVSRALENCLRQNDFAARFAGDEFIVVLDSLTATDKIIERIHHTLATNDTKRNYELKISTGYAFSTELEKKNATELLAIADRRMYEQKRCSKIMV